MLLEDVDVSPRPAPAAEYRAESNEATQRLFCQEPWPNSTAPDAFVQARALSIARQAMAGMPSESSERTTAVYLASGWSNQACFAVHTNGHSVFAKATRNLEQANLDDLNNEYQAAKWAYQANLGPAPLLFARDEGVLVMEFLRGGVLTANEALQRVDDVIALLRRFHTAPVGDWQAPLFDPVSSAHEQLTQTLALKNLPSADAAIIEHVTRRASAALAHAPAFVPVPCHTDFHVQNIVLDEQKRLYVVDCEDAGLGDPMWDLGTLTANLATMGSIENLAPLALADRYGTTDAEKIRLRSHFELSLGLYAGWTAAHGSSWQGQHQAAMHQLRKLG